MALVAEQLGIGWTGLAFTYGDNGGNGSTGPVTGAFAFYSFQRSDLEKVVGLRLWETPSRNGCGYACFMRADSGDISAAVLATFVTQSRTIDYQPYPSGALDLRQDLLEDSVWLRNRVTVALDSLRPRATAAVVSALAPAAEGRQPGSLRQLVDELDGATSLLRAVVELGFSTSIERNDALRASLLGSERIPSGSDIADAWERSLRDNTTQELRSRLLNSRRQRDSLLEAKLASIVAAADFSGEPLHIITKTLDDLDALLGLRFGAAFRFPTDRRLLLTAPMPAAATAFSTPLTGPQISNARKTPGNKAKAAGKPQRKPPPA